MAEVGYNDTAAKTPYAPIHPEQHQKSLHSTLESVDSELEQTERRLRELRLIQRSCRSALEAFKQEQDEAPMQDPGY